MANKDLISIVSILFPPIAGIAIAAISYAAGDLNLEISKLNSALGHDTVAFATGSLGNILKYGVSSTSLIYGFYKGLDNLVK